VEEEVVAVEEEVAAEVGAAAGSWAGERADLRCHRHLRKPPEMLSRAM